MTCRDCDDDDYMCLWWGRPLMMWAVVIAVLVLSVFHLSLGLVSVCVGLLASIQAEVWMAHSVSPIWSGGFVSSH